MATPRVTVLSHNVGEITLVEEPCTQKGSYVARLYMGGTSAFLTEEALLYIVDHGEMVLQELSRKRNPEPLEAAYSNAELHAVGAR